MMLIQHDGKISAEVIEEILHQLPTCRKLIDETVNNLTEIDQ